jgi:hypothetical protein
MLTGGRVHSELTGRGRAAVMNKPSEDRMTLPDVDDAVDVQIVKENLHAVQAIYFAT